MHITKYSIGFGLSTVVGLSFVAAVSAAPALTNTAALKAAVDNPLTEVRYIGRGWARRAVAVGAGLAVPGAVARTVASYAYGYPSYGYGYPSYGYGYPSGYGYAAYNTGYYGYAPSSYNYGYGGYPATVITMGTHRATMVDTVCDRLPVLWYDAPTSAVADRIRDDSTSGRFLC